MLNTQNREVGEGRDSGWSAHEAGWFRRSVTLFGGLVFIAYLVLPVYGQRDFYHDARGLVEQSQTDLRFAVELARRHGKELQRIDFAQRHLSDFDRALSRGKWDKGKLDSAIDDLQNVVNHNTLEPEDRDRLRADLRGLRDLRLDRDR